MTSVATVAAAGLMIVGVLAGILLIIVGGILFLLPLVNLRVNGQGARS